jgi:ABC-2 type transport system permease protein
VAVSSLFGNQIAVFFVSLAVVLFLWFFRPPVGMGAPWSDILGYFNILDHYYSFFQGMIDMKDVTYFLSLTALGLFVGTVSVQTRRWR